MAPQFSQEDLLDGLTEPSLPLIACSQALDAMRAKLTPYWSECSTDADLRKAAHDPDQPLCASGAARLQVLRRPNADLPLQFSPEDLKRRIEIDWKPIPWNHEEVPSLEDELALSVA